MPTYVYKCKTDGVFEIVQKMEDATWDYPCPECGMKAQRDTNTLVKDVTYHTDGFYTTDRKGLVGKNGGDKQDYVRKIYEQTTGEKAPPPATDVPRNSSEKY